MNRELTFRLWDKNTNRFYYLYLHEIVGLERTISIPKDGIIQQDTGLKDKDDKEIYEGDILLFGELHYEVSWCEDRWTAACPNYNRYHWPRFEYFSREAKCSQLVGNIFENPELLK